MLKWLGEQIPKLFQAYGWKATLIVLCVLIILLSGVAWLFGFNLSMLGLPGQ